MLDEGDVTGTVTNETVTMTGPNGQMPFSWTSGKCTGKREKYLGGLSSHHDPADRTRCRLESHAQGSPAKFVVKTGAGEQFDPLTLPLCNNGLGPGYWRKVRGPCPPQPNDCLLTDWPYSSPECWTNTSASPVCWLNSVDQWPGAHGQMFQPRVEYQAVIHMGNKDMNDDRHGPPMYSEPSRDVVWTQSQCQYELYDRPKVQSCLKAKGYRLIAVAEHEGQVPVIPSDLSRRYEIPIVEYDKGRKREAEETFHVEKYGGGGVRALLESFANMEDASTRPVVIFIDSHPGIGTISSFHTPSHTLLSYTALIHYSHTLLSYTPLVHSSRTLLSCTPLMHSFPTLFSYAPLIHSSCTLLSYTPLMRSSHALLSYTPLIHSSHTLLSYTALILSPRTLLSYAPLIH
jgi:hypothetical protein